jgi:hypothetical protein
MARALDHILKEKVMSALLAVADLNLEAEELDPPIQADVIVQWRPSLNGRFMSGCHIGRFPPELLAQQDAKDAAAQWSLKSPE